MLKIACIHVIGTLEFDLVEVTALNLFHPTASPPFPRWGFLGEGILEKGESK